jgi:hypothetical protein
MTRKRTPMNAPDMLALLRDAPVERTAELLASVDDYRRADLGAVRVGAKPRSRKARGDRESLTDEGALRVPASAAQLGWKMVFWDSVGNACLCSVVWVSTGAQPDQVGVDVVMLDLRSDRNDGQGVTQELLEVRVIGEQQGVRVGG